ncbi:pyridoxal-phosphate dependent enzyme [Plantactinospora sp. WMMC1484]|uniref:pyridoxal-phosphate dependent enzyme n=1 Tax=Plantactinospora sp. WMMC1484 TaxID=3404122 RepID=UPI003BF4AE75
MPLGQVGTPEALLTAARTNTPLRHLRVGYRGGVGTAWLKLEKHNPTGSIKYRTALGLLAGLSRREPLGPDAAIIESSSGNLGAALAEISRRAGWRFVAVVDPKAPPPLRVRLTEHGAEVVMVDTEDEHGGFLLNRLATVRRMLREDPTLRWTDQYHSPAGAEIHRTSTVPELLGQTGGRITAIFVALSTGGTIVGVGEGLRRHLPGLKVYAVDVDGSVAAGGTGHPHLLSGIGASRRSTLMHPSHYTRLCRVRDIDAIAMCRLFRRRTGIGLGASSGAVLCAVLRATAKGASLGTPVVICPDGDTSYQATVYADEWLSRHGVLGLVRQAERSAEADGVEFTVGAELPSGGC